MMSESPVSVIILTYNEERHIERCIRSVSDFARQVYVVDSYSEDDTVELAEQLGAEVVQHEFVNQARQFNWALDDLPLEAPWLFRLDADEYVTDELRREIERRLPHVDAEVDGIHVNRRIRFLGRWIRHGGIYPQKVLRLFRRGSGRSEDKWMDEHITVDGETVEFDHDIVDENLRPLGWWIEKHNRYSTREAIELLDEEFGILDRDKEEADELEPSLLGNQDQRKRRLKELYNQVPPFVRPFLYFLHRYFVKAGYRDGIPGTVWHFLQGAWYRFLVDAKYYEATEQGDRNPEKIRRFLESEYGYDV